MKLLLFSPSKRDLRWFGLILGGIFLAIALWPMLFGGAPREWASALAGALMLTGLVAPRVLWWPHRLWMNLGLALGWINTRIILWLLFVLVITPVGLLKRLSKKDALDLRVDPSAETYAVPSRRRDSRTHFKRLY
jgi:hypothetical protein